MSCTVKGRDKDGYPLEGIDVVPNFPPRPKEEEFNTIPKLVQLLQEANRRQAQRKDSSEYWNRRYHALYQEHMALKYGHFCETCQTKRDTTPPGGCIELCTECGQGKETVQSLQLKLEKKEEAIRYWQDCYETALRQVSDFPDTTLSQGWTKS